MSEPIWWCIKVYDPKSKTYTHLSKYAETIEEIEENLEQEGYWVFVNAVPEE